MLLTPVGTGTSLWGLFQSSPIVIIAAHRTVMISATINTTEFFGLSKMLSTEHPQSTNDKKKMIPAILCILVSVPSLVPEESLPPLSSF